MSLTKFYIKIRQFFSIEYNSILIVLALHMSFLIGQIYYQAEPYNLLKYEKDIYNNNSAISPLILRPSFVPIESNENGRWEIMARGEYFNNNGAPNLENSGSRWIGKGISRYRSFRFGYMGKFLTFTIEPYQFNNKNLKYSVPIRKGIYTRMNDNQPHGDSTIVFSGINEFQFFLHHSGLGVGISNANMWWGPGMHSSLQMSNNTSGFRYFTFGTIGEKYIRNFGFDVRYIFSPMDDKNVGQPYFSTLLFSSTYYSNPQFTFGFSRSYLSGHGTGKPTSWSYISLKDAMVLPFEDLFLSEKQKDPEDPESAIDLWDEILVGYLVASFPKSGLKLYVEYGRDDHAWDWDDFSRQPDHSGASIIGLRKYGLFGNSNLVGGLEYISLIKSKFWTKRVPGTWYSKEVYDYNSYNGRWWGAHSGPDSDDFFIYIGYMGENFSIIPAFNYERHGVIDNTALMFEERPFLVYDPELGRWVSTIRKQWRERQVNIWPEVKFEYRLDIRIKIKEFNFNFYYEDEFVDNLEFKWGERKSQVWWFGVERTIDSEDFKLLNKRFPR